MMSLVGFTLGGRIDPAATCRVSGPPAAAAAALPFEGLAAARLGGPAAGLPLRRSPAPCDGVGVGLGVGVAALGAGLALGAAERGRGQAGRAAGGGVGGDKGGPARFLLLLLFPKPLGGCCWPTRPTALRPVKVLVMLYDDDDGRRKKAAALSGRSSMQRRRRSSTRWRASASGGAATGDGLLRIVGGSDYEPTC